MTDSEFQAARAKRIADLQAMPGPKPLKPIPREELEWAVDDLPPTEDRLGQFRELLQGGGVSLDSLLDELDCMVEESK